jgi:hypothetical protein
MRFSGSITSGGGQVQVTGTGGGSGSPNHGIYVQNGQVTSGGSGTVEATGTAGAGTGSFALLVSSTISTAASGAALNLTGDSMHIDPTAVISAGSGIATLRPKTPGGSIGINLGGADAAGTLGLTDAELDRHAAHRQQQRGCNHDQPAHQPGGRDRAAPDHGRRSNANSGYYSASVGHRSKCNRRPAVNCQ